MYIKLRDGSKTRDPRLGRIVQFDDRSRLYCIRDAVPAKPVSKAWKLTTILDQGKWGSCVGNGIAHELLATPCPADKKVVNERYAREKIYFQAQKHDQFPGGEYPGAFPKSGGTSVLQGHKEAVALGWYEGYGWSFSLEELILGIGHQGPAVTGLNWYEGMMDIDAKGYVHPTGRRMGGHCTCWPTVEIEKERFKFANSWSRKWGLNGFAYISFKDTERLLKEDGEAAFAAGRHKTPKPRKGDA